MELAVITKIPEPTSGGNLAMASALYRETEQPSESNGWLGKNEQVDPLSVMLGFKQEVFHLGEVLILDASGREPGGHGRKPGKWHVEYETFGSDVEAAAARSREVSAW